MGCTRMSWRAELPPLHTLYNLNRNYSEIDRKTGRAEIKLRPMATCGHVKALLNLGLRYPKIIGRPNVVIP